MITQDVSLLRNFQLEHMIQALIHMGFANWSHFICLADCFPLLLSLPRGFLFLQFLLRVPFLTHLLLLLLQYCHCGCQIIVGADLVKLLWTIWNSSSCIMNIVFFLAGKFDGMNHGCLRSCCVRWQDGEGHSEHGGCNRVWLRSQWQDGEGEKGTPSVVAAIAMARWRGGRRAQGAWWLQLCCDRDDKMERDTAMWGDGDQN